MYAKSIGYGEQLKCALYIMYDMEISDKKGLMQNLKRTHPILAYRIERLGKLMIFFAIFNDLYFYRFIYCNF